MRLPSRSVRWLTAGAVIGVAVVGSAWAQSAEELKQIEKQLAEGQTKTNEAKQRADQLAREVNKLQTSLVASAKAVQDAEEQASEIEATLERLEEEEELKSKDLEIKLQTLGRTLVALERVSTRPIQAMFFAGRPPIDEARGARLLAAAALSLDQRATELKSDLGEILSLRASAITKRNELARTVEKLAVENKKLSSLLLKKSKLQAATLQEVEDNKKRLDKLAKQASSLKDLVERIERARQAEAERAAAEAAEAEAQQNVAESSSDDTQLAALGPGAGDVRLTRPDVVKPFPQKGDKLVVPARGSLGIAFGERTEEYGESKGLVLQTRPGAQVVAPFDGEIVFQGPFRNYGQILIIEHAGGYHTILAGLDQVGVVVGQWLLAGEPVGSVSSSKENARLYIELRREGEPFDPAPWFGSLAQSASSGN